MKGTVRALFLAALAMVMVRLVLMAVVPVFEPSEARYAAISANMARTGDYVVPRFTYDNEYQSFDGKPPLVFQAGGLCCRALGTENPVALQLGVRMFPFASALVLLGIVFGYVRRIADRETAVLSVAVCGTITAFYAAAGMSMTDISLTCCVAGSLMAYDLFARTRRFRYALSVALLLGLGMMVKGPVALALFGLPVAIDATVNRRWKAVFDWRWIAAAPLFLLVAVPWFVLVEQRNPGAVWYFFYNENFMRFVSHDYGDKYGAGREAFHGVSVLWALVATMPWSLVAAWSAGVAIRRRGWREAWNALPVRDFTTLAFLSIVGFWCLTSRVLLYYLFPAVPLFAVSLALRGERRTLVRMLPWCALATLLVTAGALFGGMAFSDKMQGVRTAFDPRDNHYAYEFYHGTPPAEVLMKARERRK